MFGNDPVEVAEAFAGHLRHEFDGVFREVVFAVPDAGDGHHGTFRRVVC